MTNTAKLQIGAVALLLLGITLPAFWQRTDPRQQVPDSREEVLFWHFWGGADREVVERVVDRFNRSQQRYFVRAVAMPGNNLDLKLFLAVTGGDPPDLINQDDPIVADWAYRGALRPLDELAEPEELSELRDWLYPAARRLGEYDGRLFALCNALDVRALYYNATLLEQYGLQPPETLEDLDRIAATIAPPDDRRRYETYGYLPDPRRLWAWGVVFGGRFYDAQTHEVTAHDPRIVAALEWMNGYTRRYGAANVAAFRVGDQSLPGKTFPLLAGRYALLMDGQWRVRDIAAAQQQQREEGEPVTRYGVSPLPPPPNGLREAGWVNGNFFLVPRGANNPAGAWTFMKFWSGFGGQEQEAARTCAAGGWIPVSPEVVRQPVFQRFLDEQPLFRTFVDLAGSENQFPTPIIPGAPFLFEEVNDAAATSMYRDDAPPRELLQRASQRVQAHLHRLRKRSS